MWRRGSSVSSGSVESDRGHGEWRSLVAHPAGGRAVAGSNPVSPTKKIPAKMFLLQACGKVGVRGRILSVFYFSGLEAWFCARGRQRCRRFRPSRPIRGLLVVGRGGGGPGARGLARGLGSRLGPARSALCAPRRDLGPDRARNRPRCSAWAVGLAWRSGYAVSTDAAARTTLLTRRPRFSSRVPLGLRPSGTRHFRGADPLLGAPAVAPRQCRRGTERLPRGALGASSLRTPVLARVSCLPQPLGARRSPRTSPAPPGQHSLRRKRHGMAAAPSGPIALRPSSPLGGLLDRGPTCDRSFICYTPRRAASECPLRP